jgi:enoyl-CoA hydratase
VSDPEIFCERRGAAGVVRLNRPKALNALTLGMVRIMHEALDVWEHDEAVKCVIVTAAGERAFCAGGDIRNLYDLGLAGRVDEALQFWWEEYPLNVRIKRYPKPYVALIDGIVMGGGVGVSLHGSHRVAGERYAFAMPEVGIGFFPDVGATYALPRLPGNVGTYLALTGARVGQGDALALGLATHAASSAALGDIEQALIAGEGVDRVLRTHSSAPKAGQLDEHRAAIEACFSGARVSDIITALEGAMVRGSAFASDAAATMATKSPTSLAIALAQMRRGGELSFEDAMRVEFRIVSRIVLGHDFYEGVRALIVDKDQAPAWEPAAIGDVTDAAVAAYFAPLEKELELP